MRTAYCILLFLLLGTWGRAAQAQWGPVAPSQGNSGFRLLHHSCTFATLKWQHGTNEGSLLVVAERPVAGPTPGPAPDSGYVSPAPGNVARAPHVSGGAVAAYYGPDSLVNLTHLRAGRRYTVWLYAFNANLAGDTAAYASGIDSLSFTTSSGCPAVPTRPDSALTVTNISCKWVNLTWARGNGQQAMVIIRDGWPAAIQPGPDTVYQAYASMLYAPRINPGARVVYAGYANRVSVNNLEVGHTYRAWVYSYNTNAAGDTAAYTDQRAVQADVTFTVPGCPDVTPSVAATRFTSRTIDCSTVRLACRKGNGEGRLFVIRKSNALLDGNTSVQNEQFYPPSNLWARGFPNQPDCYAVYAGADTAVTVYGLAPNQIYKVAVYEYNTVPGPAGFPDGNTPFYQQNGMNPIMALAPACSGTEPTADPHATDYPNQTRNARIEDGSLTANSVRISWHPSMTDAHYLRDIFGNEYLDGSGNPCCPVAASHQPNDGVGSYVVIHNALSPRALALPVQNTVPAVCSTVYGQGSPVRPGQDSIYSIKLTQRWDDTTVTITGLRPGTVYFADVFTFRYPAPTFGNPATTTPYTYYLSTPQASVSIVTKRQPLPVTLTGFTAACRTDGGVDLHWTTANELNNGYYAIERSSDGLTFAEVGRYSAAGTGTNASATAYYWQDFAVPTGTLYYRLRQADRNNGPSTFGPVRSVTACGRVLSTVKVAPNPLPGGVRPRLYASGLPAQTLTVQVLDVLGREVSREQVPSASDGGSSALLLRGRPLHAGLYVVHVRAASGQSWTSRLVVE